MIKDGCLEGVQEIYALRNTHLGREKTISLKVGELMAGATDVDIEVSGLGGHASEPANAIDPITALCHIHVALHAIKTQSKQKASLNFGLLEAGTS
jgi:metal-dependent amidase/aminoacylase/carboxypeptidase family protein